VRKAVTTGRPYGSERWAKATALPLGIDLTPKPRGLPPKQAQKKN